MILVTKSMWLRKTKYKRMNNILCIIIGIVLIFLSIQSKAQDKTILKDFIVEPPTLISLGFEWYISGDDNRNASIEVFYRNRGDENWKQFLPLLRIGNEKSGTPEWNYTTENMFAGSIFDLSPGTEYECKLVVSDPDGIVGEPVKMVNVQTRKVPVLSISGRIRHVYPENWTGEKKEPAYNGLLHAYYGYPRYADWILTTDPVRPGDVILMHGGEYKADYKNYRDYHGLTFDSTYALTIDGTEQEPIVIKSAGDGEVTMDGNGTARFFDITAADYNFFEGIHFRNAEVAICAGTMNIIGCNGLVVKNCRFEDIGIGIQAQFEGSRNFYIADNEFIGREDTSMVFHHKLEDVKNVQRLASYYAVKLHGQGHTVCYNRVKYFFDGIDICTHSKPETDPNKTAVAIDFYNNDIFLCNDNFIEADGGNHNIRILRNRCFNSGQQALSNQPVLGGPVYWIRNVVYNCGDASTFKFWGMYPAGILAYHNTSSGILTRDDKPASNVHFRNNLFMPSNDASMPSLGLYTYTSYSSLDYNGYRKREPFIGYRAPKKPEVYNFSEDDKAIRYNSLSEFSAVTGQEKNGITADYDVFVKASPPEFKTFNEENKELGLAYPVYFTNNFDFRLKSSAKPVDAGCLLPGINDGFTGLAPDLGAYENGTQVPHYGPRNTLDHLPVKNTSGVLLPENKVIEWRGFNQDSLPSNWSLGDGVLTANGSGGDIVTKKIYNDFELAFEYRLAMGGNSGVFFHVQEGKEFDKIWRTGIEMQIIDNRNNPLAREIKNSAGSLYALYPPIKDATKPAGKWNSARIKVEKGLVEYWINGKLVNSYQMWTKKWYSDREETIHNKTRKPAWGEFCIGHIALQDEGYKVAYRNIKIRELQ